MNNLLVTIFIFILTSNNGCSHILKKRQIFREQVLPHAGGKIPDHAFESDRLALNRLQKEGIAIPDGILLEQRLHQVFPHPNKAHRPTLQVSLTPDGRYTPQEGKYHHLIPNSIDSTYPVPQVWNQQLKLPLTPYLPVYKPLRIPNHIYIGDGRQSFDTKYKDTSKLIYGNPTGFSNDNGWHPIPPPQTQPDVLWSSKPLSFPSPSFSSHSFPSQSLTTHSQISHSLPSQLFPSQSFGSHATSYANQWKPFQPLNLQASSDYVTNHLFGDFDSFFKSFNSRFARNVKKTASSVPAQPVKQSVPIFKKL